MGGCSGAHEPQPGAHHRPPGADHRLVRQPGAVLRVERPRRRAARLCRSPEERPTCQAGKLTVRPVNSRACMPGHGPMRFRSADLSKPCGPRHHTMRKGICLRVSAPSIVSELCSASPIRYRISHCSNLVLCAVCEGGSGFEFSRESTPCIHWLRVKQAFQGAQLATRSCTAVESEPTLWPAASRVFIHPAHGMLSFVRPRI